MGGNNANYAIIVAKRSSSFLGVLPYLGQMDMSQPPKGMVLETFWFGNGYWKCNHVGLKFKNVY